MYHDGYERYFHERYFVVKVVDLLYSILLLDNRLLGFEFTYPSLFKISKIRWQSVTERESYPGLLIVHHSY